MDEVGSLVGSGSHMVLGIVFCSVICKGVYQCLGASWSPPSRPHTKKYIHKYSMAEESESQDFFICGKGGDWMKRQERIRPRHPYRCKLCGCYLDPAEGKICQECMDKEEGDSGAIHKRENSGCQGN